MFADAYGDAGNFICRAGALFVTFHLQLPLPAFRRRFFPVLGGASKGIVAELPAVREAALNRA